MTHKIHLADSTDFTYMPKPCRMKRAAKIKADSSAHRAELHQRNVKIDQARDADWKREVSMMGLLGYGRC